MLGPARSLYLHRSARSDLELVETARQSLRKPERLSSRLRFSTSEHTTPNRLMTIPFSPHFRQPSMLPTEFAQAVLFRPAAVCERVVHLRSGLALRAGPTDEPGTLDCQVALSSLEARGSAAQSGQQTAAAYEHLSELMRNRIVMRNQFPALTQGPLQRALTRSGCRTRCIEKTVRRLRE